MTNEPESKPGEASSQEASAPSPKSESSAPDLSAVEVLTRDDERMDEMTQAQPNTKRSWLPWKRSNGRDQQLRHLREGYIELLGLVRSISHHLDRQKDETSQVSTLVESLPPALNSFEKLATSQKEVTAILGNLNSHMEKTSAKDDQLLENLEGFNSALQDVSSSNKKSLGTLHQVSERIEHSDEQMKMLFENAHQSSQAAGALMVRLEKRVFLSNLALVVLLSLLLLVGVVWITKMQPSAAPTVITIPASPAAVAAAAPSGSEAGVTKPVEGVAPPQSEVSPPPLLQPEPESVEEGNAEAATDDSDALFPVEERDLPESEVEPEEEVIETLNLFDY